MRILHILDHSLPLHSGYSFRTLAILKEQRALGWETLQLTTQRHGHGSVLDEMVDGWRFHRTPTMGASETALPGLNYIKEMGATARRLEELVDEFKPNVLHAHSPVLNALPALRVGRKRNIPVVYELRASWEDAAVDHGTTREGSLRYRLSRALETYALRRVDGITTICEGLRNEIVARGISVNRITVIPNAVDAWAFRFGAQADPGLRQQLGLVGSDVVGFAGSFYGYEGLDLLVDAIRLLAPTFPSIKLLLVGGGAQEEALKSQVAAHRIADRVVFTGRVPHADVQKYYDLIDVLAYPRRSMRLTELVTPLKPLEAMAQGRMLVASDVGGHRELIRNHDTGLLFRANDPKALADAIQWMLTHRAEWPALRERARHFVETERTWARSVARYADIYDRLTHSSTLAKAA